MFVYLYIHACMHACMNAYIHVYIHTHIHTYMHTYVHTCRYLAPAPPVVDFKVGITVLNTLQAFLQNTLHYITYKYIRTTINNQRNEFARNTLSRAGAVLLLEGPYIYIYTYVYICTRVYIYIYI